MIALFRNMRIDKTGARGQPWPGRNPQRPVGLKSGSTGNRATVLGQFLVLATREGRSARSAMVIVIP
jgi:hypothetical protein